jgi:predicted phage terminase large subunit-like protein
MNRFDLLLRRDALTFAQQAHIELHERPLNADPYIHLLTSDVEGIVLGDTRRYLCNLPPGHGKTFIFSVMLPAWVLAHNPSAQFLISSYGEDLATEISRQIRTVVRADWFRSVFTETTLAKDHQSARDFATTVGGRVHARSIDGAVTGVRCDYLICDDLVQIRDCTNLPRLEQVNDIFDTDLTTRLNDPQTGRIVAVHHRLHPRDLTGHLKERKGYKRRVLSLVAPEDRTYRLKNGVWPRKKDQVLRPDAYTAEVVTDLRENTRTPGFGPLFQQSFNGPEVLLIGREDFVFQHFYRPPDVPYVLSIDPNYKGEYGQSYAVIQCWGILGHHNYLLYDQWRGRANRATFVDQINRMKAKYRPRVILVEDNGPALELKARIESSKCRVELVTPRGDKLSRLRRHLDLFRNGRIVLPMGAPFVVELITEFRAFPYGDYDDQVDAATQLFDYMESNDLSLAGPNPSSMGALGNARKARSMLSWNAGSPSGPYVFSRRYRSK